MVVVARHNHPLAPNPITETGVQPRPGTSFLSTPTPSETVFVCVSPSQPSTTFRINFLWQSRMLRILQVSIVSR